MKNIKYMLAAPLMALALNAAAADKEIVRTDAYRWAGDTIFQNEFKAWAQSPYEIRSTYKGRPGYNFPISQKWERKNDLSSYPRLTSDNMLHQALFNMALDEMVNAVEPDTTLRTGKEWAGVWTRDVSYSIILSMAYMQPEASMISLMKKVNPSGQIIQDTGSGGAWPISTDRIVWTLAAYEIYKVTGDRSWLEKVYPIAVRSLAKDKETVMSESGLVKGETSFIDWREQSYPRWMQTVDISQSEAMGTNVMYAAALNAVGNMAQALGKKKEAESYFAQSQELSKNINDTFWMEDNGYYGMYTYGRQNKILNPRAETLGEALSILYDIAPADRQKSISEHNPNTPYGIAIFYPQISDIPNYHNNALWPWVASYWTLAQAKVGNEQGVLEGMGSVYRPAALFCTNKENLNLDNGDIYTELNSSNMLWCLAGNIALTTKVLFGIHFENDGLRIQPFVPEVLAATRTLDNFSYRGATLNITVEGFGSKVQELTINGKKFNKEVIPAKMLKGNVDIVVKMDNQPIESMNLNRTHNKKAPLTPTTWIADNQLQWNPIEYIGGYVVLKDGNPVASTRQTSYTLTEPGSWQVIGLADDGTPSFASEPRSNRAKMLTQFQGETKTLKSSEVSYKPADPIEGFTGNGFIELDRSSEPAILSIYIPEDGTYSLTLRYANGNGPVNTENKAAVRTLTVDGVKAATMVMPHRGSGNWNDWGTSNYVTLPLTKGMHDFGIIYLPEDENMNINTNHAIVDRIEIEKL